MTNPPGTGAHGIEVRLRKPGVANAVRAGHPWVYRDALSRFSCQPGAVVTVRDPQGGFLGRGVADAGPIAVRVWPSPNGRVAIVEVRGENTEPGMGFFPDVLSFVSLASPLPAEAPVATSPGMPAARVVGARGDTRAARHFIRRGLDAHRGGDFERSSMLFAKALLADPGSAGARYDLACALARRGNLTAALVLLRELRAMDCPRCRELLDRASSDPDLVALRSRLP